MQDARRQVRAFGFAVQQRFRHLCLGDEQLLARPVAPYQARERPPPLQHQVMLMQTLSEAFEPREPIIDLLPTRHPILLKTPLARLLDDVAGPAHESSIHTASNPKIPSKSVGGKPSAGRSHAVSTPSSYATNRSNCTHD